MVVVLAAAASTLLSANLQFDIPEGVVQTGRTLALKTTVVQTSGDWLVIDGVEFSKYRPSGEKGRLEPSEGSLAPCVVRYASDLFYAFSISERGRYDVWERVRFPVKGHFNHSESMDYGAARRVSDSVDPINPDAYLPPGCWHWVRTGDYELQRGGHLWRFLPPGAWGGGAELDRIVLVRQGSKTRPESATMKNREVRRIPEATLYAKRVNLSRVSSWKFAPMFDSGDGSVRFEYSLNQEDWHPVPVGDRMEVKPEDAQLFLRIRFVAAPDGKRQPIVYGYRFEIERTAVAEREAVASCDRPVGGIRPLRIVPNKIVYDEGEKGWLDIVLTNASEDVCVNVVVDEKWGLADEGRELWRGDVAFANGERKVLKVDYPGSAVRYGHEVRVRVGEASRSEFFNVNSDWWRVNQGCSLEVAMKNGRPTPQLKRMMDYYGYAESDWNKPKYHWYESSHWDAHLPGMGPFLSYDNLQTRWQIHKSSVGGNAVILSYPEDKVWGNLQNRPHQTGLILKDTKETQARGLHHTHYTIPFAESGYGFEVARRTPEFFRRDRNGRFAGLFHSGRIAANPVVTSKLDTLNQTPWLYVEPNLFREDVTAWALDDLVAAVTGIGEDGVYFDGRYMQHSGFDAFGNDLSPKPASDEAIVRNMKMTLERIFKANPRAYIWSNGARADNPEMVLADHPQSGLLKETQWQFLLNPQRPDHTYQGFMNAICSVRDLVYKPSTYVQRPSKILHVGYLSTTYNVDDSLRYGECWVMASHVMAIIASANGHPFAASLPMRPWKQMMTRYSELFWHADNEIVDNVEDVVSIDSLHEIWYRQGVYRREAPGFTQYTVNLVNAPDSEACDESVVDDPSEADDVEVELKVAAPEGAEAWAIRPYGRIGAMEPCCEKLPVKAADGSCVVTVPPFTYYTLLVVRIPKVR